MRLKFISYLNGTEQEFLLNLIEQDYLLEAVHFILNNKKVPKDEKFELSLRAINLFVKSAI